MGQEKDNNNKKKEGIIGNFLRSRDKNNESLEHTNIVEEQMEEQKITVGNEAETRETEVRKLEKREIEGKEAALPKKYVYLGFMDNKVYIKPTGDPVISPMTERKIGRDTYDFDWGMGTESIKGKLAAKPEYCVAVDMTIEDKKERRKKAVDRLCMEFADEINAAKKESVIVHQEEINNQIVVSDTEPKKELLRKDIAAEPQDDKRDERIERILDTAITDAISAAKTQICEDIANTGDDVISSISVEAEEKTKEMKRASQNNKREIETAVQKNAEKIVDQINEAASDLKSRQEQIMSREKSVYKKVEKIEELCEAAEMMEGRLQKLDQLDQIESVLSDKGIEINREYPPTCEEEEDIINLVRYSKKITEQLGYAARELIRKKSVFENKDQSMANEQKVTEQKISDAREEGILTGKITVVKALLEKYADIDTIIDSEDPHVHVIWPFLQEAGAEIDGDGSYKKGEIIDLSDDDVERMAAIYKKIQGAGKYRVVKTGIKFAGEIVFKAEFEKVREEDIIENAENKQNAKTADHTHTEPSIKEQETEVFIEEQMNNQGGV